MQEAILSSSMWVPRTELRSSGLKARTPTHSDHPAAACQLVLKIKFTHKSSFSRTSTFGKLRQEALEVRLAWATQ